MTKAELCLKLYFEMLRIRLVEDRLAELHEAGELKSVIHLSRGQEAGAVGVSTALRPDDLAVSTHRCHAHYLAKGGSLKTMVAELMGKETGCGGGRAGSMLLSDKEAGLMFSSALVGGSIPLAVGMGLKFKLAKEDKVAVAYLGDGAAEEGIFWESLNFAAVHGVPVLFACENNGYATHAPILKRQPFATVCERVGAHGLPAVRAEDNDVVSVMEHASALIDRARNGLGPSFLEIPTYRWNEHWGSGEDWHLGYRSKEEGDAWKKKCPLLVLGRRLKDIMTEELRQRYEAEIRTEIDEAVAFARSSPSPAATESRRTREIC